MMLIPYVFSKKDVIHDFDTDKKYENWISSKLKSNKILKVRRGLYVVVDISGLPYSNKYEIASKISDTSFICYHSALEYYGLANQVFNNVIVGSKTKFNNFSFNDIDYEYKIVHNYEEVKLIERESIRVSSLERTIIDCIDDVDLAGGIEEVLNALEQIKIVDELKLLKVLHSYNKVILYQKVGYILEHYKEELLLSNNFFKECKSKLTNQVKYFLENEYQEIEFNSDWKLMAPKYLKSRINGG